MVPSAFSTESPPVTMTVADPAVVTSPLKLVVSPEFTAGFAVDTSTLPVTSTEAESPPETIVVWGSSVADGGAPEPSERDKREFSRFSGVKEVSPAPFSRGFKDVSSMVTPLSVVSELAGAVLKSPAPTIDVFNSPWTIGTNPGGIVHGGVVVASAVVSIAASEVVSEVAPVVDSAGTSEDSSELIPAMTSGVTPEAVVVSTEAPRSRLAEVVGASELPASEETPGEKLIDKVVMNPDSEEIPSATASRLGATDV